MRISAGTSDLVVFSFTSTLDEFLPASAVHRLLRESRQHNQAHGLTGRLDIEGREVRQVVEGSWSAVMPLVARILNDPRHRAISIDAFSPIAARSFGEWTSTGDEPAPVTSTGNLLVLPFARPAAMAQLSPLPLEAAPTAS